MPDSAPTPRFVTDRIDADAVLRRVAREDAIAMPVLSGPYRSWLLEEAEAVTYREARPTVGSGERTVLQRMGVFNGFARDSRFHDLTGAFQELWNRALAELDASPFERPLEFNDLMLQVYEPGEVGITPHLDRTAYRNLICLFVLAGEGRFGVCPDRTGRNSREIPHRAGDVVFTAAPGLYGSDRRPFHYVQDIRSQRYVFGLRHEHPAPAVARG